MSSLLILYYTITLDLAISPVVVAGMVIVIITAFIAIFMVVLVVVTSRANVSK